MALILRRYSHRKLKCLTQQCHQGSNVPPYAFTDCCAPFHSVNDQCWACATFVSSRHQAVRHFFFIFAPPHHFFSLTCSRLRISATKRHHGTVASLIYLYIIFYSAVSMTLRNFLLREMETQCENQT